MSEFQLLKYNDNDEYIIRATTAKYSGYNGLQFKRKELADIIEVLLLVKDKL